MINPILARRRSNAGKKSSGHLDTVEFPRLIKISRPSLLRSSIHASQNSTVELPANRLDNAHIRRWHFARVDRPGNGYVSALWWCPGASKNQSLFSICALISPAAPRARFMFPGIKPSIIAYAARYLSFFFFISHIRVYSALLPPCSARWCTSTFLFVQYVDCTRRGRADHLYFNWWLDSFVSPLSQLRPFARTTEEYFSEIL